MYIVFLYFLQEILLYHLGESYLVYIVLSAVYDEHSAYERVLLHAMINIQIEQFQYFVYCSGLDLQHFD